MIGGIGVAINGQSTVLNYGLIVGGYVGVKLGISAELVNQGTIAGSKSGAVGVSAYNCTVKNYGVIRGGSSGDGPIPDAGGIGLEGNLSFTGSIYGGNGVYGSIKSSDGGLGVSSDGGINSGTIFGGNGGTSGQYGSYAGLGGIGLEAVSQLINNGTITGGIGGSLGSKSTGGTGGIGVRTEYGTTFTNNGTITGGAGGQALQKIANAGTGGTGFALRISSKLVNNGKIFGGNGGAGYEGHGGAAIVISGAPPYLTSGTNTSSGTIAGGTGGSTMQPDGASGGAGVILGAYNSFINPGYHFGSFVNHGLIDGGIGGRANDVGGIGGVGVVLANGAFTNSSHINGGMGGYGSEMGGEGGFGAAIYGGVFINNTTIIGGAGGSSRFGNGLGGIGIYLNGGKLEDAGTIANGPNGGNVVIEFGSHVGTLDVLKGAVFEGNVIANPSVSDILEFSGKSSTLFTGIGTQFQSFNDITFQTHSQWTISGDIAGLATGQKIVGFQTDDGIVVTNAAAADGSLTVVHRGTVTVDAGGQKFN